MIHTDNGGNSMERITNLQQEQQRALFEQDESDVEQKESIDALLKQNKQYTLEPEEFETAVNKR